VRDSCVIPGASWLQLPLRMPNGVPPEPCEQICAFGTRAAPAVAWGCQDGTPDGTPPRVPRVPETPLQLTLPGGKMPFEEVRCEGTYCAPFRSKKPGLASKIAKAAQELAKTRTCAVIDNSGIFLVFNSHTGSSNAKKQLKDEFFKFGVSTAGGAEPDCEPTGEFVWLRPMHNYLKRHLENELAPLPCRRSSTPVPEALASGCTPLQLRKQRS